MAVRFVFLQACSGKLLLPNVPQGHQWTGAKVQRLAKQGDVYIRPTYPFQVDTCTSTEENVNEVRQLILCVCVYIQDPKTLKM